MPMPLWWGQVNKRVFNPRVLKRGISPVLTHKGRSSDMVHRTPLDAYATDDGYLFILVYGPRSDWVQNVLQAGSATLEIEGSLIQLAAPKIISIEEATPLLPETTKKPPGFLNITDCLLMVAAGG
jgi:deazaflavin-dependent oxidoreductase (nitroreductase family)